MARVLLAPVFDQHLLAPSPCCRTPGAGQAPATTHPSSVAPGGVGQPSEVLPAVPHRGAVPPIAASWVYSTYTYGWREVRGERQPEQPSIPEVVDLGPRSANTVGVVSASVDTLTIPLFSATNTDRPLEANSRSARSARRRRSPPENPLATSRPAPTPARAEATRRREQCDSDDRSENRMPNLATAKAPMPQNFPLPCNDRDTLAGFRQEVEPILYARKRCGQDPPAHQREAASWRRSRPR